jgi:hydrogenase maturation protease
MEDRSNVNTLILGVGNLLLSDEAAGLRVVEKLVTSYDLPDEIQALDGGTLGLDLLYYLEGIENLLIIDAVEMRKEPGTLIRLENDEVPAFMSVKMSPHQIGITDMLFAARLSDIYPSNLVLWGIQPGSLETGLELTPPVAAQVDTLVEKAIEELACWGHKLTRKPTGTGRA